MSAIQSCARLEPKKETFEVDLKCLNATLSTAIMCFAIASTTLLPSSLFSACDCWNFDNSQELPELVGWHCRVAI